MSLKNLTLSLLAALFTSLPALAQSPVAVRWEMLSHDTESGFYNSRFIIKNVSAAPLERNWQLYFNQFSRTVKMPPEAQVDITEPLTTYYQITPNDRYRTLAPGDSLIVAMQMKGSMVNKNYRPAGTHLVLNGDMSRPIAVELQYGPLERPEQWRIAGPYPDGNYSYAYNQAVNNIGDAYTGNDFDIFPTPKTVEVHNGFTPIGTLVSVKAPFNWKFWQQSRPKALLTALLASRGIYVASGQNNVVRLKIDKRLSTNPEAYTLDIDNGNITIAAPAEEGLINGIYTFVAAIDHSKQNRLQNAHVADQPDLHYRGYMLDIARNFTSFDNLKRFIDLLAYYKINRFQFHFCDDEAWRLEIPGLPELTAVAARRGATLTETDFLAQIFDGNGNPNDPKQSANGYLTRSQFVDLLRYAHLRGVKVIPEIETPGHARAAIIAMRSRLNKTGANTATPQYVLWDKNNTSVYTSAQSYHDNVLNVASEGVYAFIVKVVTELQAMYKDAGLKLDVLHMGGDEVPMEAWNNSPDVKALMQRENLRNAHDVNAYFISRVTDILYPRGILVEGWQEVAQHRSAEFNRRIAPRFAGVNAWSTIGSRDTVPYAIANDGYPVILSNVTNFYMDMGYNWHPYEQGLHWGGKVDELDAWSALPLNVYASARTAINGDSINVAERHIGKTPLRRPENIIGVQAQLWAETIRNFDQVQYLTLPKVLGLVERAWNASPEWGRNLADNAPFDSARHQFNLKIGTRELPLLARMGYNFRVAQPGIKLEGNTLLANAIYPNVDIHYTLDGSEPTLLSPRWTAPVTLNAIPPVIKARAFYLGRESVVTLLFTDQPKK